MAWILSASAAVFVRVGVTTSPAGDDPAISAAPLTLPQAVDLALRRNPDIQKALQEIRRARGLEIEMRARILPRVSVNGNYSQQDPDLLGIDGGSFGTIAAPAPDDNAPDAAASIDAGTSLAFSDALSSFSSLDKSYAVAVEARQVIYAGGRIRSGIDVAKLTRETSWHGLQDTVSRVVTDVRRKFSETLLSRQLVEVREESIALLKAQLAAEREKFDAGAVAQFNVLRAEVELANARPELIRARTRGRTAALELAVLLGSPDDARQGEIPALETAGSLDVEPPGITLHEAITHAKERRASLEAMRRHMLIEAERIEVAVAGRKPRFDASAGYTLRSSPFGGDLDDPVHGWFFGVTGSWDIFDGFETAGKMIQAKARLAKAQLDFLDAARHVELEVRDAWDRMEAARETVAGQLKTVGQAREALRLARERLEAGAAPQLETLDARTALTEAQLNVAEAKFDYAVARADFDYAAGRTVAFTSRLPVRSPTK